MKNLSLNLAEHIMQTEPVFKDMEATVEASPYHREANVLVHTKMVMQWYSDNFPKELDEHMFNLGLFACMLHDIAKPKCRTRKENKERGVYYSYNGHDHVGKPMIDQMLVKHNVHEFDVYRISWMVQHHQVFWSTKNEQTFLEMAHVLKTRDFYPAFKYFMLADDFGRIVDQRQLDSFEYFRNFELNFMQ